MHGAGLVRRMGGGDQQNAIQTGTLNGRARDGQVSFVDGVESAAEYRQSHGVC